MFKTSDLSLNQYHHVFFQVSPDTPNVLTTYMYDNAMNSLGTLDASFGNHSIVNLMTMFDQSGTTPFVVGSDHTGDHKLNMDLGFFGLYNNVLKTKQHQTLMKYSNQNILEPHTEATIYIVTVNAGKFFIDGVQTPFLVRNPGIYVFDQRDPTNANHPLRLSETEDGTHDVSGTEYTFEVVKNGTPGTINAYTMIRAVSDYTPDLYYYCSNHSGMGGSFSTIELVYYIKVVQNIIGKYVYAISTSANGTYYNQMQLSFTAGKQYLFDIGDPSNTPYRIEFGTTVDNSNSINTSDVYRDGETIILDLTSYSGQKLLYFEDTSAGMGYVKSNPAHTTYTVIISGTPSVFDLSGSKQPNVSFSANQTYVFDQSDPTNTGNQIFFGTTPDASDNYIIGKTIMGEPGQVGAYTQISLPSDFTGDLYYYHDTIPFMGNGPLVLSVDETTRTYGEVVTFTITNRTGVVETYTITGVSSADINGADLSGSVGYGQQVDLSYTITGGGSDMVFSIGGLSETVTLVPFTSYQFSVKENAIGESVWAMYDVSAGIWYNQPDLSFSGSNVYKFDVSDASNNGYVLSFGTTVDVSDATIESSYVTRDGPPGTADAKVLLDLRNYTGDALVYFEESTVGMGYVETDFTVETLLQSNFTNTDVLTGMNALTYTLSGNSNSFANGTYTLFASNYTQEYSNLLRNVLKTTGLEYDWHTKNPITVTNTYAENNGLTYSGVYIELIMPYRILLTQAYIQNRSSTNWANTKEVSFLGSNDGGSTFYFIEDFTFATNITSLTANFTSSNTEHYSTIRMVIRENKSGSLSTEMRFWSLTGDVYEVYEDYDNYYAVTVSGDPGVFDLSGTLQPQIAFAADTTYIFDQSDSTNAGQQIVFGYTIDDSANILTSADGVTVMGTPGQPGAYTQLDLSAGFVGTLYYYNITTPYMGYGPLVLSVDETTRAYGEVVTFTVTNRTGVAETYTITGVSSADINGAALTGSVGYGQQVDLSYTITGGGSDMVFSIGGLIETVTLAPLTTYEFAVQDNALGQPVWAMYDTSAGIWYNQPELSFSAPNVYKFDVSDASNIGYVLSFGTTVDVSDATVESTYVSRDGTPGETNARIILDLRNYTGDALVYFENLSAGMGYIGANANLTSYTVIVANSIFELSGTPQPEIVFVANQSYVFDQSDSTNAGYQIVFGTEPDASTNYTTGKTIMGTPGQPGAYTQLVLPADFSGSLFYYHDTTPYMGYGPLVLSVDDTTRTYGEVVTFTVTNRTGVVETYTITGVSSADINGAALTGSVGYGQQVDLSYTITNGGTDMVFSIGGLSETVTLSPLPTYQFTVKENALGDSVWAMYDTSAGIWYNQPELSFSSPNVYKFDVSDASNNGYVLSFGTTVDTVDATIESTYVTRDGTPGETNARIILDLRNYTGDALVYFEESTVGMGYSEYVPNVTVVQTSVYNPGKSSREFDGTAGGNGHERENASQLDSAHSYGGWSANSSLIPNAWMEIRLSADTNIAGVITQGRNTADNQWVSSYRITYSTDADLTTYYDVDGRTSWTGNSDKNTKVYNYFSSTLTARYVRIYPLVGVGLRAGLSLGTATPDPIYVVTVSGNPGVFNISDTPQLQINFAASEKYIFDQSDSTNAGQQIVFGYTIDDSANILTAANGVTVMGTPGQPGAYTQLELPSITGTLYYYSDATSYMGYGPLVLSVDETTRAYGEVVTFTVTNRTGVAETYTITGVSSADINGADLSGSVGYGQQVDLSYTITGGGSDMVFSIGSLSETITLSPLTSYQFTVKENAIGQPVWAVYDVSDATWYNQPDLSFSSPNVYKFDVSDASNNGYVLSFGTTVDVSDATVESTYVSRDGTPGETNARIILDLRDYTGDGLVYFEDSSAGMGYVGANANLTSYTVIVANSIFELSGTPQPEIVFIANQSYVFDQSDATNGGYQIVFGTEPDASTNYTTGKTIMGTPGQPGAYTQLELPSSFTGTLYYYSDATSFMGYGPLVLSVDETTRAYGEVVTFTITNRTGVVETYTITGVSSADINGAALTGSVGYGQQVDLSYTITGGGSDMVFSIGGLSETVTLSPLLTYQFTVKENVVGDLVWAMYDTSAGIWYNQPDLSFSAPYVYHFDLSISVTDGSYVLVFGTEVDNSGTVVETGYVTRETGKVILDLRTYTGDALVYFEDTSAGMGYTEYNLTVNTNTSGTIFSNVTLPSFYWDFRTTTPETSGSVTYVSDIMDNQLMGSNVRAVSSGLSFNNSTDGPYFSSSSNLIVDDITFGGECSYEAYFKTGGSVNKWARVIAFQQSLFILSARYVANNYIGGAFNGSHYYATGATTTTNTWYHVIVTVTSGGELKIYKNATNYSAVANSGFTSQTFTNGAYKNYFGKDNYGGGQSFNGNIRYVRFWQDHVLTQAEVSSLFGTKDINYEEYQTTLNPYVVTVANSVFELSGSLQPQFDFVAGTTYIFDQSDSTNAGQQMVFGYTIDDSANILTAADGVTVMGTPGQPGAYTQLELPSSFMGTLYYYSDATSYMGYGPLVLSVDETTRTYGEVVTFTVTNRTGVAETYTITGVSSADINGADLSGSVGYGQQVDLSYVITGGGSDMVFSVGGLSETVILSHLTSYQFTVKENAVGDSVWAVYDTSAGIWYNQPDLSFSSPNLYKFDVSDASNNGYVLSFGTAVDTVDATIESTYVTRDGTPGTADAKVLLDLRNYTGNALVYFEDTSAGMGYVGYEIVESVTVNQAEITAGNIDVSTVGDQSVITFKAPSDISNSTYNHSVTFPNNMDINYVAVGAGGSGGKTLNYTGYNSGGGHGGFVIEGTYSLTQGTYSVNIPGYSEGHVLSSRTDTHGFGYDGSACELQNSSGTTLIYSEGGNGSGSLHKAGTYLENYNSEFSFNGVTYYRSSNNEGRGGYRFTNSNYLGFAGKTVTSIPGISDITLGGGGGSSAYLSGNGGNGGNGGGGPGCGYNSALSSTNYGTNHKGGGGGGGSYFSETTYSRGGSGVMYIWGNFSVGTPAVYYTVTVTSSSFYLSNVEKPQVNFTAGTSYFFDQSDSTNAGQQIVFGYTPDDTTNILTAADGVTVMGTPGQPGAYTQLDLSAGFVGTLYYYSDASAGMGYYPILYDSNISTDPKTISQTLDFSSDFTLEIQFTPYSNTGGWQILFANSENLWGEDGHLAIYIHNDEIKVYAKNIGDILSENPVLNENNTLLFTRTGNNISYMLNNVSVSSTNSGSVEYLANFTNSLWAVGGFPAEMNPGTTTKYITDGMITVVKKDGVALSVDI